VPVPGFRKRYVLRVQRGASLTVDGIAWPGTDSMLFDDS